MEEGMNHREDVYSLSVRAGKRTYFFDIKATKGKDLYMTITESKRRYSDDGKFFYEKHKLFLYKEDFEKFREGLEAAVVKINELRDSGEYPETEHVERREDDDQDAHRGNSSGVSFEDLSDE